MDKKVKERIQEIDNEIEKLLTEKQQLNPFASLKSLSWKEFGRYLANSMSLTMYRTSQKRTAQDMICILRS